MRRHALYALLLAAVATSALAAEKVTLRLGDVKGDRFISLRASGQLDNLPYELKLSSFDSGAPVQEALNAGALDVGFTGDLPFLFVYAAGASVPGRITPTASPCWPAPAASSTACKI